MKEQFLVCFSIQVDVPSCFVGLVLENCELPYPSHGHVILADPSPIVFYPISRTEVRCRLTYLAKKYLLFPMGNVRTMTNRSMLEAPLPTPGALLMGDAFNMCHPLTGGGMTVALSDISSPKGSSKTTPQSS
ncbi:hypothetical protein V6N11_074346 [Hibiscus sabdariffa]|uniref:Squalene monooxygenase n=1 Tax=Hibiscus sabdariffa TaxID=183260 RepID=A0ABR2R3A0_9ROSI